MTSTLFTNVRARRLPSMAMADWVLIDDGRISGVGSRDDVPHADRTISGEGAVLLPAFVDAHVHLPATGLYATGLDFRGTRHVTEISDAFHERSRSQTGPLFGGNFEDPLDGSLDRHVLDRAVGERTALLARADMHSCVVSTALLQRLDLAELQGVDRDEEGRPTGYLREQAAAEAWEWFDRNLGADASRAAIQAAAHLAYSKGVASVHEMHVVEWRGWDALDVLVEAIDGMALTVVPYVATADVERVVKMGFDRIGGDYFLDGSFGSHTAWLSEPYLSQPPTGSAPGGISYRDGEELHGFFLEAQSANLQVGVHAIGDAAIEQAIATWERVARDVGVEEIRRKGHRIEHFECATDDHIQRAARLGLRASVQPAFDRSWGGPEGLYAERMGKERAANMNRFASMLEAGLMLGAGSDSTVTPLDPFLQMASLRSHHVEEESVSRMMALKLHTLGARAMAWGPSLDGSLEPGAVADLVLLDRDPIEVEDPGLLQTEVLGTWIGGMRVWPLDRADRP